MSRDANLMVKNNITQIAIDATLHILEQKLDKDEKQNLIDQSIKDLASVLKN